MSEQFLNRLGWRPAHRQVRTERVTQHVDAIVRQVRAPCVASARSSNGRAAPRSTRARRNPGASANRRPATRSPAPNRCLRSTRSARVGSTAPAGVRDVPSSRRRTRGRSLRRTCRTHGPPAADSAGRRTDDSRLSADPSSPPTSASAASACVCPSPCAQCSTAPRPCRSLRRDFHHGLLAQ
jgi:hypothetical protein